MESASHRDTSTPYHDQFDFDALSFASESDLTEDGRVGAGRTVDNFLGYNDHYWNPLPSPRLYHGDSHCARFVAPWRGLAHSRWVEANDISNGYTPIAGPSTVTRRCYIGRICRADEVDKDGCLFFLDSNLTPVSGTAPWTSMNDSGSVHGLCTTHRQADIYWVTLDGVNHALSTKTLARRREWDVHDLLSCDTCLWEWRRHWPASSCP